MTLIVNKRIGSEIQIHSDTRISDIYENYIEKRAPLSGVLKSIIISPEICVSFAGTVEYAQEAIETIFEKEIFELENLKNYLLQIHRGKRQETDFSIATTVNDGHLIQIQDGEIVENNSVVWLGDYDAFSFFQQEFLRNSPDGLSSDEDLAKFTYTAFEETIKSENQGTVSTGDFHISVKTKDNKFQYQTKFSVNTGPQTISFNRPGEWVEVPYGSTKNGSYGESYLISETENKPAIGIHFVHGGFGILFAPKICRNAIKISDVVWGDQFIQKVEETHGIRLAGFVYTEKRDEKQLRELNECGTTFAGLGKHDLAIQKFDDALTIREVPEVLANRGLSLSDIGHYDRAIADFSQALELGLCDERLYRAKAVCHAKKAILMRSDTEKVHAYLCIIECLKHYPESDLRHALENFSAEWIRSNIT